MLSSSAYLLLGSPLHVLLLRLLMHQRATAPDLQPYALLAIVLWAEISVILWFDCSLFPLALLATLWTLSTPFVPAAQAEPFSRNLGKYRLSIYLTSVLAVASLANIHLPISTFLTSPGEIGIHLQYLLSTNTTATMIWVYLALAIYGVLFSPRMRTALTMSALWVALVALIYSYLLPFGYPLMSGLMFEQIPISTTQLLLRALTDAVLVGASAVLVGYAILKKKAQHVLTALLVINLSLIASTSVLAMRDVKQETTDTAAQKIPQPLQFSGDKPNVLILFLDRFMGGFIEKILKDHPELEGELDGFRWYPLSVAAGENSIAGVHPIFGGYDYMPHLINMRGLPLRDVSTESYRILPINFSRNGYETHLINPRGLGFTMAGDCNYMEGIPSVNCNHISSHIAEELAEENGLSSSALARADYADLLVLLGGMRQAPYLIKAALNEKGPWKPFLDHSAETTFRQWAELKSLPELTQINSTSKNLNILWNVLPHEPYFMGEDCLPKTTALSASRSKLEQGGYTSNFELQHYTAARCSLLLVRDYMQWMKKAGVYDNTKIVIVSDHGIVGPVVDHSSRAIQGGTQSNKFVRSRSVLLVKDRQTHGKLFIDETFMPNAEVPRIVCTEIGGCKNPYLNDKPVEALGRDDPFVVSFVPWQFNLQKNDEFVILHQMRLIGRDPYSRAAWQDIPRQ